MVGQAVKNLAGNPAQTAPGALNNPSCRVRDSTDNPRCIGAPADPGSRSAAHARALVLRHWTWQSEKTRSHSARQARLVPKLAGLSMSRGGGVPWPRAKGEHRSRGKAKSAFMVQGLAVALAGARGRPVGQFVRPPRDRAGIISDSSGVLGPNVLEDGQ